MLQNIPSEKILDVVKQGPTLPAKIVKQVGGDTMIVGAILSTIITTGKIRVSSLKVGGSPLYYIPDHESKLEDYIENLNEKDRRTFVHLKEQKVMKDDSQDALTRVSLKTIRDFSKPFYIENSGIKVLFWRFYNVSIDQAELIAQNIVQKLAQKSILSEPKLEERTEFRVEIKETSREHLSEIKPETKFESRLEKEYENISPQPSRTPIIHEKILATNGDSSASVSFSRSHNVENIEQLAIHPQIASIQINEEVPKELASDNHEEHTKEKLHQHNSSHAEGNEHHARVHKEHPVHEHKEEHKEHHPREHKSVEHKIPKEKPPVDPNKKEFYDVILNFITTNGLDIISKEKLKKSEYNLILKNHNTNEYIYCKAKDKGNITDADLAPALIFAQNKKMPCLFLATGDLSQKTVPLMDKEFSGMMFKKI